MQNWINDSGVQRFFLCNLNQSQKNSHFWQFSSPFSKLTFLSKATDPKGAPWKLNWPIHWLRYVNVCQWYSHSTDFGGFHRVGWPTHPLINNPWRAGMVSPINAGESIRFVHFGREYIFRMLKDAKSGFSWMLQQNILVIPAQENNLDSRVSVGDFQHIFL